MSGGILRFPWTSQPQTPVGIDWGNPAAKGIDIFLPDVGQKSIVGTADVTKAGSPVRTVAAYGRGWQFTSGSDAFNTTNWPVLADGTQYTYLVVYVQTAVGSLGFLVNGDNSTRSFQIRVETSGAPTLIGFNTAVSTFSISGSAGAVGSKQCVVFRQGASAVSLFQNGVNKGSTASSGTIKGQTASDIQIGNRTTNYLRGSIGLIVRWPRALSDAEAISVSANPWQLFAPIQRTIWVPAAAGGATYTLTCAAGSYAIAGQAATLAATHNYALACAAGAYTYTGKAATLTYTPGATTVDYTLTCVAGAYAISGQAANLTYARSMVAAAGAYAISGQAATLTVARNFSLATGAYVISGKNAVLTYTGAASYTLTCDAGAYSISGGAATLLWSGVVPSTAGGAQTGSGGGARAGTGRELRRLIDQIFEKKAKPAAVAKAILTVTPELTQLRDAIEVLELRAVKAPTSPKVTELLEKLKIAEQEADDEEQVVALLLLS